jgi:hypothetical protein
MLVKKRNGRRKGATFIRIGAKEVTILFRASQDLACLVACDALTGMFERGLRSSSSGCESLALR